ncbi:MAG TPA: (d)CMP kinase [Phaeodactylibacter sp.]|nr:(d)CMP kinase [Phaeodactylibacter sp.]
MKKIIITIDGHSACGKSTLAKALAQELDYGYIDTGAMYRAVTYFFLENRVNIQKTAEIERALTKINITFKNTVAGNRTFLNGRDVEDVIRKMFVSKNVSHVSAISTVRRMVVRQQQEMGRKKGIVMEGRDIGTVVFPKAELKIFLTADEEVRTQRRFDELKKKGHQVSANSIKANLRERDLIDSTRKDSPLKKAKEAVLIDNTNLNQKEQLLMTWALAKERIRQVNIEKTKQKNQSQKNQNQKTKSSPKPKQTPTPRNQKTNQNQKQKQNQNQKTKTNSKTKKTSATRNQKNQNQNQKQKTNQKQNQKTKSNPKTKQTPATRNQKVAQKNQKQKQNQKTKTNSKTKQTSATRNQKVADKNTAQKNQKATAQTSKKTTTSARSKKTAPKNISKKVKPETPKKATPTTRKKATPKTKKKDNK